MKKNKIRCKLCGKILESKSVHDFNACSCGTFVDGGLEYVRLGWPPDKGTVDDCIEIIDEDIEESEYPEYHIYKNSEGEYTLYGMVEYA